MNEIFFGSCKSGFKVPSALFCQCCSGLTCCIDLGLFLEKLLSTDHRLSSNAAKSGSQLRQTSRKNNFTCQLEPSPRQLKSSIREWRCAIPTAWKLLLSFNSQSMSLLPFILFMLVPGGDSYFPRQKELGFLYYKMDCPITRACRGSTHLCQLLVFRYLNRWIRAGV